MAKESGSTRESVREMVREMLRRFPDTDEPTSPAERTEHVLVNSLREKAGREFDRDESSKSLITEDDLRGLDDGARLRVSRDVKFTPLSRDIVAAKRIELIVKDSRAAEITVRAVALGADHGGFEAKEAIKQFLAQQGIQVRDFGTNSADPVDYPDFAHLVARAVSGKNVDVGILIDGAGIGCAMAANKIPGVRAAACYSPALARNAREHNGANVLTLGAGQNSLDEIKEIIMAFVTSGISEERHKRRVAKIDSIEREYIK
jgi:ribose 5-phosphate isomerase B